jgi:tetratricopeptide (TPR) repeat protein
MQSNRVLWFLPAAAVWMLAMGPSVVSAQETGAGTAGAEHLKAEQYVAHCVDHYQKHDLVGALAECKRAIDLSPKLAIAYYNRGAVYFALYDFKKALDDYNHADQYDPNEPETLFARGVAHYKLHENGEARHDYQAAIDLGIGNPTVYLDLGVLNFEEGNYPEAEKDYTIAIKKKSDFANAYVNRAVERSRAGDNAGARADYDQAINLDANDASTFYDRAKLEFDNHDVARAIQDYTAAIRLDGKDPNFFFDRAIAYENTKQWEPAVLDYRVVIGLRPDDSQAYFNLANVEYTLGTIEQKTERYQDAANDYTAALRIKPQWAAALRHRGLAYIKLPDLDNGIRDLKAALDLEPQGPEAAGIYFNLGLAYLLKDDFPNAIAAYSGAIDRKFDTAEVYYDRGLAYQRTKEIDKAIEDFKVATGKNPEYGEAWRQLGEAYEEKAAQRLAEKDQEGAKALWADAAPCLEKAKTQLKQPDPNLYDALGRAHFGVSEYKAAAADYENEIQYKRTAEALVNEGSAFFWANELKRSITAYKEATTLKPDFVLAYCGLNAAYLKDGQVAEAEAALKSAPPDTRAHCRGGLSESDLAGLRDFDNHDLSKAAVDYKEAVNHNPKDPLAHYGLGVVLFQSNPKDISGAIQQFSAAIEIRGDFADALNARGLAYLAQRDWPKAKKDLQQAADLRAAYVTTLSAPEAIRLAKKKQAESLLGLADAYGGQNEWAEALPYFKQSTELNPDNPLAWEGTALALYKAGKLKEAVEAYDQVISKRDSVEAHLGRGDSYAKQGDLYGRQDDQANSLANWQKALLDYRTADQMKPHNAGIVLDLGIALVKTGDKQGAAKAYKEAIRLQPNSDLVYYDRADLELREKQLGSALADSTKAVGLSKRTDADALDVQGITLADSKRPDGKRLTEAKNNFSKALTLKQNDVDLLSNRATTEVELRQYGKALEDLTAAIGFAPKEMELVFRRAEVELKMNRFSDAVADYGLILQQKPEDAEAFYRRGIAYGAWGYEDDVRKRSGEAQNHYAAAISDYQTASKSPAYAERAWANLWDLYRTMGDDANAKAALAQAKQLKGSRAN